ncbi:MAG: DUF883 family protein [Methylotenera sp.]|nr:DUF883 family protein [Methylotenera sp.]
MDPLNKHYSEEQLIEDFKSVVADLEALLQETAHSGGEKMTAIRAKAEQSIDAVKASMADAPAAALNKAKEAATATDDYVQANPWRSIGLAVSVGVIIGLLLSRRSS